MTTCILSVAIYLHTCILSTLRSGNSMEADMLCVKEPAISNSPVPIVNTFVQFLQTFPQAKR